MREASIPVIVVSAAKHEFAQYVAEFFHQAYFERQLGVFFERVYVLYSDRWPTPLLDSRAKERLRLSVTTAAEETINRQLGDRHWASELTLEKDRQVRPGYGDIAVDLGIPLGVYNFLCLAERDSNGVEDESSCTESSSSDEDVEGDDINGDETPSVDLGSDGDDIFVIGRRSPAKKRRIIQ